MTQRYVVAIWVLSVCTLLSKDHIDLLMSEAVPKKKQKIGASVATTHAKAAVNSTWAAWNCNPSVAVRVVISHIKCGGTRGDKKPSWMLLTPIGDV